MPDRPSERPAHDARAVAPTVLLPLTGLAVGSIFADRYEILAILGQGGMGAVYRAHDRELDETIALKVLRIELASEQGGAGYVDRFRREVKLARRVTHSNVARTYDLGRHATADGEVRFLTMELIEGEPLSRRVGPGRKLAIPEALKIGADIARGLAAAHAVGVVHRDLKPDNVMLARDRAVITDFGIARASEIAGGAQNLAQQTMGAAIGTPAYMAPEQVEGREVDGRADVFAFGILLFEMLTGTLPFHGDSFFTLAAARLTANAPDPRTIDPLLPEPLVALVRDALARRREDRPDAQQVLQRLEVLRGAARESVDVAPPSSFLQSIVTPSAVVRSPTPSGPRTIALAPLLGNDAAGIGVGNELTAALSDGLSKLRSVRVLAAGGVRSAIGGCSEGGVLDASALGRALHADWVIDGSTRVVGDKVRVRVRLVEVATGVQPWADRFEGALDELFAIEDRLVESVVASLRTRVSDTDGRRGPSEASAREAYERARTAYFRFTEPGARESIHTLEEALVQHPNDPWLLSALGASRTRLWLLGGAMNSDLIVQAEEVSLRALAIDASIGETFNTIGIFRLQHGELRAAVQAFHEALARSPLLAESHEYLGRLLIESGHVDAGIRRLLLATRLDKRSITPFWERARVLAMQGDYDGALNMVAQGAAADGSGAAGVLNRVRFAVWFPARSATLARKLVVEMNALTDDAGGLLRQALPIAEAIAEGKPFHDVLNVFDVVATLAIASPRQRAFFFQLAAEVFAMSGQHAKAIAAIERSAELPLIDLFWLDACPALVDLRDDPAFARVRAVVAARVAQLWA